MRGLYFLFAGLLVLVVAVAGCVGKEQAPGPRVEPGVQPEQPPPALGGDTVAPASEGVQIEAPAESGDETVDIGSLI